MCSGDGGCHGLYLVPILYRYLLTNFPIYSKVETPFDPDNSVTSL